MKKWIEAVFTFLALAAAVFFGMASMQIWGGSLPLDGVEGIESSSVILCMIASVLSLFIFLLRLSGTVRKPVSEENYAKDALDRVIAKEVPELEAWSSAYMKRLKRQTYLTVVLAPCVVSGIGIYVKAPLSMVLFFHFPIGLIMGEVAAVAWIPQKSRMNIRKIWKKYRRGMEKALPGAGEREQFAEDMQQAESMWRFRENGKETFISGILGDQYWLVLHGADSANIVDVHKIKQIETETVTMRYKNQTSRSYVIRVKCQKDEVLSFDTEQGAGACMAMIKKRLGDSVLIQAK